ncbi:MAG: hypothetical protein BGO41_10615 [Clostridiales bacterium 38-18]|nr:MAG: hypothetical protein BGO41_10615 [Clostridiales bacterium 38-18]
MIKKRYMAIAGNLFDLESESIHAIRLRYGLEMFYLGISKLLVVIVLSMVLGIFWQSIITLAAYNLLRQTAQGLHAKSSVKCMISSLVFFIMLPWTAVHVAINPYLCIAAALAIPLLAYLYAPSDTAKKPIINKRVRDRLKKKSIIRGLILTGLVVVIPDAEIKSLITIGAYVALLYVLPITYRIMKEERNNYEKFEKLN